MSHFAKFNFELYYHDPVIFAFIDSDYTNTRQSISFSCVCPVVDHEFRHSIVKEAVDPQGDSRVDPKTTICCFFCLR